MFKDITNMAAVEEEGKSYGYDLDRVSRWDGKQCDASARRSKRNLKKGRRSEETRREVTL